MSSAREGWSEELQPRDLPVGRVVDTRVESYFGFSEKYFCSHLPQIKSRTVPVSPTEGRIAIVTDAGWDAVDAAALGARRGLQGGLAKGL